MDDSTQKARLLLLDCLNDDERPWAGNQLVERMEEVFFALGGQEEELRPWSPGL
jgi:hypothetical protein